MKRKSVTYNDGECEVCDGKLEAKLIKQDFWIRGKLIVIGNVPAGVCPRCGAKVVRSQVGKPMAAVLGSPTRQLQFASDCPIITSLSTRSCVGHNI